MTGVIIGEELRLHVGNVDLHGAGRGAGLAAETGVEHRIKVRLAPGKRIRCLVLTRLVPGAQRVGAALGAVPQVRRCLERRAHGHARGIGQALRIAVAAERPLQPVALGRVERAERRGGDAHQVLWRGDELAGIHAARRVERRLDRLKRAIGLIPDPVAQVGAPDPLAVLAPEDPAMLACQGKDRVRHLGKCLAVVDAVDVQRRPDVQAADIRMAVDAVGEAEAVEHGEELFEESSEVLRRHHGILDKGHRPGAALCPAKQAHPCGTYRPKPADLVAVRGKMGAAQPGQVVQDPKDRRDARLDLCRVVPVHLDEDRRDARGAQRRGQVAQQAGRGGKALSALVHHLDSGRVPRTQGDGGGKRGREAVEPGKDQALLRLDPAQTHADAGNGRQSPL